MQCIIALVYLVKAIEYQSLFNDVEIDLKNRLNKHIARDVSNTDCIIQCISLPKKAHKITMKIMRKKKQFHHE